MKRKQSPHRVIAEKRTFRLNTFQLKLGMFVCKLDRPWEQTPFSFQGFMLRKVEQIEKLKEYCDYVYIDLEKSVQIRDQQPPGSNASANIVKLQPTVNRVRQATSVSSRSMKEIAESDHRLKKEDLEPAEKYYKEASSLVKSIMQDIKLGRSIDTPAAKQAIAACVDNIIQRQDALLLMSRLRDRDEYTSQHSLNVAIIAISLGRYSGLEKAKLNEVGLCGLLHDMGKMLTPNHILNKPGKLTDDEMEIMRQHPADGYNILSSSGGLFPEVIQVAHTHHERMDGGGYPRKVPGKNLSLYSRIVTIADVFDAVTADRIYKDGATIETALRIMYDGRGISFDPILVTQFIESVGIYPLGTVVELQNGEIGLVVHSNPEHRLRPWVKIILGPDHEPIDPLLVDLSRMDLDSSGNPYWIKASHNPRNFDIDLLKHLHSQII